MAQRDSDSQPAQPGIQLHRDRAAHRSIVIYTGWITRCRFMEMREGVYNLGSDYAHAERDWRFAWLNAIRGDSSGANADVDDALLIVEVRVRLNGSVQFVE